MGCGMGHGRQNKGREMTTQHPEALRLAEELDDGYPLTGDAISAAAALRRQHARITELEAQLPAIGAGGVSPLMAGAEQSEGQHAMALKMLIAAGFVPQSKADEAMELAKSMFTTQELSIAGETK